MVPPESRGYIYYLNFIYIHYGRRNVEKTEWTIYECSGAEYWGIPPDGYTINYSTSTLVVQGAMSRVSEFSITLKVSDWLFEIDKFRSIHGLNDKGTCQLAWAKSKGGAFRQIGRRFNEQPDIAWSVWKEKISCEFGKIVDD